MLDQQLLRYSRQILLPEVDVAGQERLLAARVLLIGAGGLGCPAASYLAAAGVGRLIIVDDDVVELSNLQRQILHYSQDVGAAKVDSASSKLKQMNPDCDVLPLQQVCDQSLLEQYLPEVDLLIDACDNFATRFLINAQAIKHNKPLVSGAAIAWSGQVAVFAGYKPDLPCYQCLYDPSVEVSGSCADNGVLSPLVGVIGSLMATAGLKVLLGQDKNLFDQLQCWDALKGDWRSLKLKKDAACKACS